MGNQTSAAWGLSMLLSVLTAVMRFSPKTSSLTYVGVSPYKIDNDINHFLYAEISKYAEFYGHIFFKLVKKKMNDYRKDFKILTYSGVVLCPQGSIHTVSLI